MKRTKLIDRKLPIYSKGEEIFNMTSHIVGASLGFIGIILCIIKAAFNQNIYGVISCCIFLITLVLLYVMSSIYHGLNPKLKAKKIFQIIDHCSIFLLIAGTYTPFALSLIRQESVEWAWGIMIFVWSLAIIGIVLNSIDLKKYSIFSMIAYLGMGWCIIVKANILVNRLSTNGLVLLVSGGIVYTIGAILYGVGKKKKWMHSVFHLACVVGSLLQILCILLYVV